MRVTVSEPSRLNDLRQYFRGVHAVACVEGETLTVHLAGAAGITDTRHLRAYLDTWLQLSAAAGRPLSAEVSDE